MFHKQTQATMPASLSPSVPMAAGSTRRTRKQLDRRMAGQVLAPSLGSGPATCMCVVWWWWCPGWTRRCPLPLPWPPSWALTCACQQPRQGQDWQTPPGLARAQEGPSPACTKLKMLKHTDHLFGLCQGRSAGAQFQPLPNQPTLAARPPAPFQDPAPLYWGC